MRCYGSYDKISSKCKCCGLLEQCKESIDIKQKWFIDPYISIDSDTFKIKHETNCTSSNEKSSKTTPIHGCDFIFFDEDTTDDCDIKTDLIKEYYSFLKIIHRVNKLCNGNPTRVMFVLLSVLGNSNKDIQNVIGINRKEQYHRAICPIVKSHNRLYKILRSIKNDANNPYLKDEGGD